MTAPPMRGEMMVGIAVIIRNAPKPAPLSISGRLSAMIALNAGM